MKKLFTSDLFFFTVFIVSIVGMIAFIIFGSMVYHYYFATWVNLAMVSFCEIGVAISYRNHQKNLMKGLLGAMLMALILYPTYVMTKLDLSVDHLWAPINMILCFCLFVNHFLIHFSRKSHPVNVKVNQILCVLLALNEMICNTYESLQAEEWQRIVLPFLLTISFPCLYAFVVCVESRLDAYRVDRERAGWSEENELPKETKC